MKMSSSASWGRRSVGWFVIFVKELTDMLRDRRTLFMMIGAPLVIMPLLMTTIIKVTESQVEKARSKELKIAVLGGDAAPELTARFSAEERFNIFTDIDEDSVRAMTAEETLDGAVIIPSGFYELIKMDRQASVKLIFKSSESFDAARRRIENIVGQYSAEIVNERIDRLDLDPTLFEAVVIVKEDVASTRESFAENAGGFLPYLFIIFGFMGSMYPALDLGAGEKERGTLETILSSPASRFDIVLGKFLVVMLFGVLTALVAILGVFIMVWQLPSLEVDIKAVVMDMLGAQRIIFIMSLVLPVTAFFAATGLAISIFAKSFKEAQSIMAPLNFVIIIPAAIGMLPGFELNYATAAIPILNLALATKAILAGNVEPILMAEVYLSLFALAGISIFACAKWFNREETLFRS